MEQTPLTLDVAIVTYGDGGIARVAAMTLPRVVGVRYIVSWQSGSASVPSATIPPELQRDDIEIHRIAGRGVAANRNNALRFCRADIILNADDDLHYTPAGLRAVIRAFADHPEIDFATFRYTGNNRHKRYPSCETSLRRLPKGFSIGTIELALRRRTVVDAGVRFDERFGPGAPLATGEDSVMLLTLRRLGLSGRFFPVDIVEHPGCSTGARRITDAAIARAHGAIIGMAYPATALLRVPLKAFRLARARQMALLPALVQLGAGYFQQLMMPRPWNVKK